ncbi:DUF2975 domain-containing protein [Flavobacterium sp. SE-s28]|uniref:DUF2975 domain-containing protein n=2 Tax=Flavobacterium silvaticum TaxID=1852020 RepID=A0A972FNB3_9FLAO|nr:DUF2975 domain-containing protein [Flavobacterium silvaticum]
MLTVLYWLSWIILTGLCVDAGSFIFNGIYTTTFNPAAADYFKLSELYHFDAGHYLVQLTFMTIVGCMKALMFYLIVMILHDKKLDLSRPFTPETGRFISNLSYLCFGAGLFSDWGSKYALWLSSKNITMPDSQALQLGGADVWLFSGVLLLVIAQIFRKGIELQHESDLTI